MDDQSTPLHISTAKTLLLTDKEIQQLIDFFKSYRFYQTYFHTPHLPSTETLDHLIEMFVETQQEFKEKE